MNILDENIPVSQYLSLRKKRIPVRQIGFDAGRKGMTDDEIIPLLHRLDRPTLFTLDNDFLMPACAIRDIAWFTSTLRMSGWLNGSCGFCGIRG